MELDSNGSEVAPLKKPGTNMTPAARIAELNEIDKCIAQLLSSASTATAILANSAETSLTKSLESAQEEFRAASSEYFSTLSSIDVRLRRQVYALEEAGLISAGTERDTRRGRTLTSSLDGGDASGMGGRKIGGGALDPSWLNARVGDGVEVRKKMEILKESKETLANMGLLDPDAQSNEDNMDESEG